MGTVFEAEHLTLGRLVAVKVLHPNQAKKRDAVQRFYREARAAACIGHPNVCDVYDLDTLSDGSPFLVMEKLVGGTLANRIVEERRLPLHDLTNILVQVLSALGAAHDRGIVHRDIKPENIFISRREGIAPLPKLLDFGVSKRVGAFAGTRDDDVDLTQNGMVMGTPYYMSPEQARGDRDLDQRVDIYACGVILYETLTGHRPFVATTYGGLLREVLRGEPQPIHKLRAALPSGFDTIVRKAMARDREDRYGTAAQFRHELQLMRDRHYRMPIRADEACRAPPLCRTYTSELGASRPSLARAREVGSDPRRRELNGPAEELSADDAAPTRLMVRTPRVDIDNATIGRPLLPAASAPPERTPCLRSPNP